jgi:hypothetical protein
MRNVDELVFNNIIRSQQHTIVVRTPIITCFGTNEWVINNTNIDNMIVINDDGRCITSYQACELEKYYKLHENERFYMNLRDI